MSIIEKIKRFFAMMVEGQRRYAEHMITKDDPEYFIVMKSVSI